MSNLFLFTGEHQHALQEKLQFWKKAFEEKHGEMNIEVFEDLRQQDLGNVCSAVESAPFLGEKRMIIVKDFPLSAAEKRKIETEVLEELIEGIPETSLLIFVSAKPDKRSRFYKLLKKKAQIEGFDVPKGAALNSWVQQQFAKHNKTIDSQALGTLLLFCGEHLDRLGGEIEKLSLLKVPEISKADVERCVSATPEAKIFQALDGVGKLSREQVLKSFEFLFQHGGEGMMVLYMLVRQFRLLTQMRSLLDQHQARPVIQKRMKLAPFQVGMLSKQAEQFQLPQLKRAYSQLAEIDFQVKTGKLPASGNQSEMLLLKIDQFLCTLYE